MRLLEDRSFRARCLLPQPIWCQSQPDSAGRTSRSIRYEGPNCCRGGSSQAMNGQNMLPFRGACSSAPILRPGIAPRGRRWMMTKDGTPTGAACGPCRTTRRSGTDHDVLSVVQRRTRELPQAGRPDDGRVRRRSRRDHARRRRDARSSLRGHQQRSAPARRSASSISCSPRRRTRRTRGC